MHQSNVLCQTHANTEREARASKTSEEKTVGHANAIAMREAKRPDICTCTESFVKGPDSARQGLGPDVCTESCVRSRLTWT